MAWCLMAPSHYLSQYWQEISEVMGQGHFLEQAMTWPVTWTNIDPSSLTSCLCECTIMCWNQASANPMSEAWGWYRHVYSDDVTGSRQWVRWKKIIYIRYTTSQSLPNISNDFHFWSSPVNPLRPEQNGCHLVIMTHIINGEWRTLKLTHFPPDTFKRFFLTYYSKFD